MSTRMSTRTSLTIKLPIVLLFFVLLVWPFHSAFAQNAGAGAGASANSKTKRTSVDFEDQLIQGEVKKPELFYLLQKKQFNFGKLIKLRENFVPEMGKTAED